MHLLKLWQKYELKALINIAYTLHRLDSVFVSKKWNTHSFILYTFSMAFGQLKIRENPIVNWDGILGDNLFSLFPDKLPKNSYYLFLQLAKKFANCSL